MDESNKKENATKTSYRNRIRVHHGENVRKFREFKDFTQKDLAEKMQVRQQQISIWERSESLNDEEINKIAEALEIDPQFIKYSTQESILEKFKIDRMENNVKQERNNTAEAVGNMIDNTIENNYNYNSPDKFSELYERLFQKDQEIWNKEKEIYEMKLKALQDEIDDLISKLNS